MKVSRIGRDNKVLTDEQYKKKCALVAEREAFFSIPERLCEALHKHSTSNNKGKFL